MSLTFVFRLLQRSQLITARVLRPDLKCPAMMGIVVHSDSRQVVEAKQTHIGMSTMGKLPTGNRQVWGTAGIAGTAGK